MDRCDDAGNLCCVFRDRAVTECRIRSGADVDRVLAGIRTCAESGRESAPVNERAAEA